MILKRSEVLTANSVSKDTWDSTNHNNNWIKSDSNDKAQQHNIEGNGNKISIKQK